MRSLPALLVFSAAFVAGTAIPKAEPLEVTVANKIPSSTTLHARQCPSATAVAVTFNELVNTTFGQSVVITGSISQLGSWNPANGVQLSASQYSASNPLWSANATLPAGLAFSYKYVRINTDGSYDWEADPDRVYTVPSGCSTTATESDTWHSVTTTTSTSASLSTSSAISTSATPLTSTPSTYLSTSSATSTSTSLSTSSVTSTSASLSTSSARSSSTIPSTSTTVKSTSLSSPTSTSSNSVKTVSSTLTSGTTSSIKTSSLTSSSKVTTSSTSTTSSKITSSSKITTSSKLSTTSSTKTTSLSSASLTSGTTSATSTCTDSPNSRRCWNSGLSIDTDFDKNWPNTGVTRSYHLTLTNITLAPDGTPRQVFAINGQYPGPTIYAEYVKSC
nr:glucoamylase [Quercus suber]